MYIVKRLFINKLFLTGFVIISTMFLVSILYFLIFNDRIPTTPLLFDSSGKPLPAPYSLKIFPPFGTDNFGRDLFIVMIVGAKYTIAAGLIITFLRVFPSIWIGLFIHFFLQKIERPLKSIADALNYFPITLLAFLLLNVILVQEVMIYNIDGVLVNGPEPLPYWNRVVLFLVVLALLFIPTNSILISNEVKAIYNNEFIESSRTLGASNWRIVTKHIKPFLVPQLAIIFLRDFIQTLILMSHIAVLGLFIGGFTRKDDLFGQPDKLSNSNEWSGLLGMWWDFLWTSYPWIAFIPIIFLSILILSAKGMMEGLTNVLTAVDRLREPTEKRIETGFIKSDNPFQRVKLY
ncbi:ABC transporter permease [Paenisporosarcina sp. OV554]|uniref:ABC transporter permease n=1 Tax=Paenisporosarcina sp. OV554 TaxID=2135694 RepID=UPI000D34F88A|nr:ABC transporter permease subunit [Paenisporosarcina sp. OV554]PUB11140.1 ABC-type dipeptide/oligopeptide/nickel transport system permease subunit [Paenisporosarcina sp. OV554]